MKKLSQLLDLMGLTYLNSLLATLLFFTLSQDQLLFKTDAFNLTYFFAATAFVLFIILFIPLALFASLPITPKAERLSRWLHVLAFCLILFGFTILFIDSQLLSGSGDVQFLVVAILTLLLCALLALKLAGKPDVTNRLVYLSRTVFVAALGFIAFAFTQKAMMSSPLSAASNKKENVILIVLDGLSTKNLSVYNPKAKTPYFDEIASDSMVYTNIRSNFAFTSGFFYSLYSGRKDWIDHSRDKEKGLLSILQEAGVNTRWLAFNNNGIPDSHNFPHDFNYRGLRSAFLTGKTAWFPRLLGIDYNIFFLSGSPTSRGKPMGTRENAFHNQLTKFSGDSYLAPLENIAIEEIDALRKDPRPFFLVIHLPPNALTFFTQDQKLWQFGEHQIFAFEPAHLEQNFDLHLQEGTRSLRNFLNILSQNRWDQDTLTIVTSDHGRIFENRKINYVWYNDEEVARVPFLLRWKNRTGLNNRLGETIDISQTLLDFFKVDHRFAPNAVSLLTEDKKESVTTFAHINIVFNEWLLNIYKGGHRYTLNLYPGKFYARKEKFTGYYETVVVDEGEHLLRDEKLGLRDSLGEYSIEGDPATAKSIQDMISPEDIVAPF